MLVGWMTCGARGRLGRIEGGDGWLGVWYWKGGKDVGVQCPLSESCKICELGLIFWVVQQSWHPKLGS